MLHTQTFLHRNAGPETDSRALMRLATLSPRKQSLGAAKSWFRDE